MELTLQTKTKHIRSDITQRQRHRQRTCQSKPEGVEQKKRVREPENWIPSFRWKTENLLKLSTSKTPKSRFSTFSQDPGPMQDSGRRSTGPGPGLNPILTGLFANLKRLGGGGKMAPPNLAISGQMTMKLGKNILWVEILTNWQKFLCHPHVDFMTSSNCNSCKSRRFSRVLAEYLKNNSTDFHQTYVIFRQLYIEVFEIKRYWG